MTTPHRGTVSLAPLVRWLDLRGDELFGNLAIELWQQIPEMRGTAPVTLPALEASIRSHLPRLKGMLSGESVSPQLPAAASGFATRMAEASVPLPAVLRAYELGHAALWNAFTSHLRSAAEISLNDRVELLEHGSTQLFEYIRRMTGQTITVYNSVRDRLLTDATSRRAEIIRAVLAGTGGLHELNEVLGYRTEGLHAGYVVRSSGVAWGDELAQIIRRAIAEIANQHIAIPAGPSSSHGWFRLVNANLYPKLREIDLPADVTVSFGAARAGCVGFRTSHYEAVQTDITLSAAATPVLCYPDVAVVVLASENRHMADQLVIDELGSLLVHEDVDRLLPTLGRYLDTLASPTHTAEDLNLHPNTVTQRIQRVEKILGRHIDVRSLRLRVAVELARHRSAATDQ